MWFALVATVIVAVLIYKLFFSNSKKDYWQKYGIQQIDTSPAVSNLSILLGRKAMFHADIYVYDQLGSEKVGGVIEMGNPLILIKDLELIKKVLIKDFDHFVDRRQFFGERDVTLRRMLFALEGEEWKGVRTAVSPTFTTGKIRRMMDYFNSVGKEWVDNLTEQAKKGSGSVKVDAMNSVNQYTIDVIASAVFGMNAGTIKDPNSKFSQMAFRLADLNKMQLFKFGLNFISPWLYKLLRIELMNKDAMAFFGGILDQGLQSRMKGETKRNDFLQLLVEARKGELKTDAAGDELNEFEKDAQLKGQSDKKQWLTDEIMSAQSLTFFFAGFSTTSNFITFAAYVLAAHQNVQDKLRTELNKIAKPDGSFDYDDLGTLVYLDMVISEVNRVFTAAARLERMCIKEYKDAESGVVIPKGTIIVIPVHSLHHDKQYYHNPDNFDPEHFTPDRKAERNPYAYMPFGSGPRNCIGMRFALIESKAAVAHLVHNFVIEPTNKTPLPVQGRPAGFQLVPPQNLELKLTPVH